MQLTGTIEERIHAVVEFGRAHREMTDLCLRVALSKEVIRPLDALQVCDQSHFTINGQKKSPDL